MVEFSTFTPSLPRGAPLILYYLEQFDLTYTVYIVSKPVDNVRNGHCVSATQWHHPKVL